MFRFIVAFFLILTTQVIPAEVGVECLYSPVEVQSHSNEEHSSSSYGGYIASFIGNVFPTIGNASKSILKTCLTHVSANRLFYSTLLKACLATSFFGAADGFFTELKCPGFRPYWNFKNWGLDRYWDCPKEIWLCTNSTMTSDQYYAFVGCAGDLKIAEVSAPMFPGNCPGESCIFSEERMNDIKQRYDSFADLWKQVYESHRQGIPVLFEGQCSFPLEVVYNYFNGCSYKLFNFLGSGFDGDVWVYTKSEFF